MYRFLNPNSAGGKKTAKAIQDESQRLEALRQNDENTIKTSYTNEYAGRVTIIRTKLIANGQTRWVHDSAYYQNPPY